MGTNNGFTPVQIKMMAVLADGRPHPIAELHACLADELGPMDNVYAHITGIRKKINRFGDDVVNRNGCYWLVRLLPPADGRR